MTSNQYPVVLTKDIDQASNEDVVDANVNVVNQMYQELLNDEEIAPEAIRSYYVDFYLTQALAGGFAQYVFTAPDREEMDQLVREGLEAMGATGHLELFNRTAAAFDELSEEDAEAYLDGEMGETGGSPEGVAVLDELDGEFESLLETEDIITLNAAYLRNQEGLLILDQDELNAHIAQRVALIPNLEERQAEAEAEELENAPEFEIIIRELCDVAGYALQK